MTEGILKKAYKLADDLRYLKKGLETAKVLRANKGKVKNDHWTIGGYLIWMCSEETKQLMVALIIDDLKPRYEALEKKFKEL